MSMPKYFFISDLEIQRAVPIRQPGNELTSSVGLSPANSPVPD